MTYFLKYLFTLFKWIIGCSLACLLTLEMSGPPEGGRRLSDCVPWEGAWRGWGRGTASRGPLIQGYCSHLRKKAVFWIRIHWFQIKHFRLNTNRDLILEGSRSGSGSSSGSGSESRVLITKAWKKFWKEKNWYFFDKKLLFIYPEDSIMDVQAKEEAFSSQKRTSSTSMIKTWNFLTFYLFLGHFCPPGSGSETLNDQS